MPSNLNDILIRELRYKYGFTDTYIESVQHPLIILNGEGNVLLANDAFCHLSGSDRQELTDNGPSLTLGTSKDSAELLQHVQKVFNSGILVEFETGYKRTDQVVIPVLVSLSALFNTKVSPMACLVLIAPLNNLHRQSRLKENKGEILENLRYTRKRIELYTSKNLLGVLDRTLNNISDGILSLDTKWRYTYINDTAQRLLAVKGENLIGKNISDEFPDLVGSAFYRFCYNAVTTQSKQQLQDYYEPFDKWFEVRAYPYPDGLTIYYSDITHLKKIEQLLSENENYLDNIINTIGDPIFVKDSESRLLIVNDAFCSIFNLKRSDIIGKSLAEDVNEDERDSFLKIDREVLETGLENVNLESLTVRGTETRLISTKKTRFVDKNGKRFLIGIIHDITELKRAESNLRSQKEYSEALIESMREGLVVFNMKTEISKVNPAFCEMSGFTEKELLGKACPYPFSPPEIEEESNRRHEKIAQGKELENFETVYMKKDGTRFNVDVMVSSFTNPDMTGQTYFATIIDTTDRKKAEDELRLAKEFTDSLVMSMQEGLIIVNLSGKIIMVNDSTCKILGYSKEELVGMELPYPFAKPEDFEEIARTNEKVAAGEAPSFQFDFIKKNGEIFKATFLTGHITDDKGDVIALFGTMKDISEEYRSQQILEDSAIKSSKKKDVILKLASLVGGGFKNSLSEITKLASTTLNVERVSIWSLNDDRDTIKCEHLFTLSSGQHSAGGILSKKDNPEYFEALEKNRTVLIDDAWEDPVTRRFTPDYLKPSNIRSLMDVFISSAEGYYGIICFEHVGDTNRKWTADEQEFATSIASIVSLMVESSERKLAEEKLIASNSELSKANTELQKLRNKLEQENVYLRNELDLVFNFEEMVYGSAEFSNVLSEVEKVAETNATVLLLGESGTGKELLARAIHNIGLRNDQPLIKVNCSAIPRELIESELFGHKKGSFTGAFADKVGKCELADGGTLFLDEIGELPIDMQPKILRFLQEGEIEMIGGTGVKKLDVRVIAATNRNLQEEIKKKQFREDLYFRLNVFPIQVPALRDRKEDIPLLVEHFVDKFNKEYSKKIQYVTDKAMERLKAYAWPGNIRELENLIERASILSNGDTLVIPGFDNGEKKTKVSIKDSELSLDAVQRKHILQVLEKCRWKISGKDGASELLGLKPSTLRDKMSKLGIKKHV